jgi:5-methylcytosine-specific restriction endonuclease McrA
MTNKELTVADWNREPSPALWKTNAHQWGPGKVHILSEDWTRTLCGRTREQCPGSIVVDHEAQPNCEKCIGSVRAAERRAEWRVEWERQEQERQRQKQEEDARWWANYDSYLKTPQWRARRDAVIQRAKGVCEGCGKNHATMVHHLTYARVKREMLFDLVAICKACHDQVHGEKGHTIHDVAASIRM